MSDAAKTNIATQRNEDFGPFEGRLRDVDGVSTNMSGWTWELHIDPSLAPAVPLLVITGTPNGNGSYLKVTDPTDGSIELFIAKEDIAALPGEVDEDGRFYFNFITLEPDGTRRVFLRGRFIVEPAVGMFAMNGGFLVDENGFRFITEDGFILRF